MVLLMHLWSTAVQNVCTPVSGLGSLNAVLLLLLLVTRCCCSDIASLSLMLVEVQQYKLFVVSTDVFCCPIVQHFGKY